MLLAVDTSTRRIGIALFDGAQVLAEMSWQSAFHHTVELAPAVEQAFSRAGFSLDALKVIGTATGPGSFTALRTGLAFAKGLALGRNIDLVGIPSLEIQAASQAVQDLPLAAVLEAGRKRMAAGWYQAAGGKWTASGMPELVTAEELAEKITRPTIVTGELDPGVRALLSGNPHALVTSPAASARRPAYLAELAWAKWQVGETDDPATLSPVYLTNEGLIR